MEGLDIAKFGKALHEAFVEKFPGKVNLEYLADYSTDISTVLKFRVSFDDSERTVFAKWEKSEAGIIEHEYQNICAYKEVESADLYTIPEVVLFDPEQRLIVLGECSGELFQNSIFSTCKWNASGDLNQLCLGASAVGGWLCHYEKSSTQAIDAKTLTGDLLAELARYEENIVQERVPGRLWDIFVKSKQQLLESIESFGPAESVYFSHGDFHPGNFFTCEKGAAAAIDFQQSEMRLKGYDHLYFDLNLLLSFGPARYNPFKVRKLKTAFLRGYGGELATSSVHARALKAIIVLRALVYCATIQTGTSLLSRLSLFIDLRKLEGWLAR